VEDEEDEISYSSSCAAEAAAEEAAHMAKFDMVFEPTRLTTMKAMKRHQLLITTKDDHDDDDDDKQLSVSPSVCAVSCCVCLSLWLSFSILLGTGLKGLNQENDYETRNDDDNETIKTTTRSTTTTVFLLTTTDDEDEFLFCFKE